MEAAGRCSQHQRNRIQVSFIRRSGSRCHSSGGIVLFTSIHFFSCFLKATTFPILLISIGMSFQTLADLHLKHSSLKSNLGSSTWMLRSSVMIILSLGLAGLSRYTIFQVMTAVVRKICSLTSSHPILSISLLTLVLYSFLWSTWL